MACGKPVIAAKGALTADLGVHGKSLILVNSGDERGVAHAIMSLVRDDSASKIIGNQARNVVAERYSTENLAGMLHRAVMMLKDK
jgi:glycosyltransferase involved in cell wall biosynthesis